MIDRNALIDSLVQLIQDDRLAIRDRARAVANIICPPTQATSKEEAGAAAQALGGSGQASCEAIWLETLEHFGAPRPSGQLSYQERVAIAESVKKNGPELTMAALYGRRFEESTSSFTPAKHLGIHRTFDRDRFDTFINLAAQQKAKQKKYEETKK